jgi:hypothetical protein
MYAPNASRIASTNASARFGSNPSSHQSPSTAALKLVGELERYEDSYRLCYVRGPEGIIVELAEQIS